jgi:hypothetical protein
MSERRFILNKKCFAALRAIGEGKFEYAFVGPKGILCTDTTSIIRVTLPTRSKATPTGNMFAPTEPQVFPKAVFDKIVPETQEEFVELPEGLEAKTSGRFTVPNLEQGIVDSNKQTASITVNAKSLIKLLQAAIEVTDHSRSLVKLRFCGNSLRIDAHRMENDQEFCGVLMGIQYNGSCMPGEPDGKTNTTNEYYEEKRLPLPSTEGRKFR